jgi:hypothetical protein
VPVPQQQKRRVSRVALALTVLSVLVGGASAARAGMAVLGSLTQPAFEFPGTTSVRIDDPGTYAVYERTGTRSQNGPVTFSQNSGRTLEPGDITVTGPNGAAVRTSPVFGSETLTRDGLVFTASAEFRAATAGVYEVEVGGRSSGGSAVVAREFADQFRSLLPWLLALVVSGLVLVGSVIALLVGLIRASRVNRPGPTPPGYPTGYPAAPPSWPSSPPGPPPPYGG